MKKSCVLVSGGAGYIGSHTAVELIGAGYDVVIVDNLSNSDMDAVEGVRRITGVEVPFEKADCCDRDAFRKVFEKYDFDSAVRRRTSGRQRRASLEEYRETYLTVPKIRKRKTVFVSEDVRDELDAIVRRLGGRGMSVSGLLENLAREHLAAYREDIEQWRKI